MRNNPCKFIIVWRCRTTLELHLTTLDREIDVIPRTFKFHEEGTQVERIFSVDAQAKTTDFDILFIAGKFMLVEKNVS